MLPSKESAGEQAVRILRSMENLAAALFMTKDKSGGSTNDWKKLLIEAENLGNYFRFPE